MDDSVPGSTVFVIVGESGWSTGDWANAKGTVINFAGSGSYQVPLLGLSTDGGASYDGLQGVENGAGMSIVLNYPNATLVKDHGNTVFGHVIAPRGLVETNFQYNGTLVGNNVHTGSQAEGHLWPYRGGKLLTSSEGFVAQKTVNNALPTEGQMYEFILEELKWDSTRNDFSWQEIERKTNSGQRIVFTEINYSVPNVDGHYIASERDENNNLLKSVTYYYRITEDPVSVTDGCNPDRTQYYIKVVVNVEYNGDDTVVTDTKEYFKQVFSTDPDYIANPTSAAQIDALDKCDDSDLRFDNKNSMLKLYKEFSFDGTALDISKMTEEQKLALKFTISTEIDGETKYVDWDKENGGLHGRRAKLISLADGATAPFFTYNDFRDGFNG